ncbi:hypothetical protein B0T21DRAFT_279372 [Apiosordaria backusii]|uniref:Uncharacterized protein n=1 Tax=Apiosordaria backusii TaxID=314023 RepID=A0AA40EX92_9PEZI|nr:hypothetical protein B0T21DRAFT_279372 [Apiosordaria backusii]
MDVTQPTTEPPPPPPPAAAPAATLPPAPSSGTLSPEQLGALLGSVLGFAFLVLVLCCCLSCHRRRRRREQIVFYGTGSEYSESGTEVTREYYTSTRDWNRMRGPGGLGFANAEGMMGSSGGMPRRTDAGFTTVPPPARFPPTPRYTPYRQSRWPQISGVRRFP